MTNATLNGKPYAGNPHVRFEVGESSIGKPRRGSLLYNKLMIASLSVAAFGLAAVAQEPVEVGDRLQVMWDDFVVDTEKTTARRVQHHPEPMETVLRMDRPWEGDGCSYMCLVPDEDEKGRLFRLYYIACRFPTPAEAKAEGKGKWLAALCRDLKACYAESRDGIRWTRPELGINEFGGSKANNIILDHSWGFDVDNFFVFRDPRPDVPADERYKALARVSGRNNFHEDGRSIMNDGNADGPFLWSYLSADGIHFRKGRCVTEKGAFDTLNTVHYNARTGEFHLYTRGFHRISGDRNGDNWARDIRHSVSKDFRSWTDPKILDFTDGAEEYPLYTNLVQPYFRNPEILVGFPTRYVERPKWTPNFDRLPSPALRREHMEMLEKREGLTVTDCIFMMSRDGQRFERCNEAFITPGPEFAFNWVYGDAYPAYGMLLTAGRYEGSDEELSFLVYQNHLSGTPVGVRRMRLRQDGFFSRQATYREQRVVTKPLVFSGSRMLINFSTSARGYVFVTVRDGAGRELRSCELFGDKVDRTVDFMNGAVADFAGRPVTVEFRMSDADLYSFRFAR